MGGYKRYIVWKDAPKAAILQIYSKGKERPEEALFGEGAGRVLVELEGSALGAVEELAQEAGVALVRLGKTGGEELKVSCGDARAAWPVAELKKYFESSLPKALAR